MRNFTRISLKKYSSLRISSVDKNIEHYAYYICSAEGSIIVTTNLGGKLA